MRPILQFPPELARRIQFVLTDIDDTVTTDGHLPAAAYSALERLHLAGLAVVPITGRPAGWCDLMARLWPVQGVVGENGAFYFAYDRHHRRMRRRYLHSAEQRSQARQQLDRLAGEILQGVPGAAIASDQAYREADLAIDFCEDVPALGRTDVARIVSIFEQAGACAKVSSIHVNGWLGDYDKLSMTRLFFREEMRCELDTVKEQVVFCGDSPNDAPMFAYFPHACGVANVRDVEQHMPALPCWIADHRGGTGFVQIADMLLRARGLAAHP